MFGLFRRTKIYQWEIELLRNILKMLPEKYNYLIPQLDEKLLKGVLITKNGIPNFVGFTYYPNLYAKFQDLSIKHFYLSGIKVFDNRSLSYIDFIIYVSDGVVAGYSTSVKNLSPAMDKIRISSLRENYIENDDFNAIKKFLHPDELSYITSNDVFQIEISGKIYYHISALDDGDFIGIDTDKCVYRITHDPFEINPLSVSLLEFLKANES